MPALRVGQADQEIIRVRFHQPGQRPVLKLLWPIDQHQQLLLLRQRLKLERQPRWRIESVADTLQPAGKTVAGPRPGAG